MRLSQERIGIGKEKPMLRSGQRLAVDDDDIDDNAYVILNTNYTLNF